ncbi:ABC transporter permease [Micromonospora sp. NPDC004551]|uniref:ABC transporter permease n=1 Tax=Micromonospora sp. NPDC004551 TaxID=3154284 RepID=UPI0033AC0440
MIRLAIGTLRRHRGAYLGTFLAALLAVALLAGAGLLLFSVLTATPPADRFEAATAVVSGARDVTLTTTREKHKKGKTKTKTKTKTERLSGAGTLPADLAPRLAELPGVARVVPDAAFPVELATAAGPVRGADAAPVIGHGWSSAALTPYRLRAGRPPAAGEAVVDADLAARGGLTVGDEVRITTRTGVRSLRLAGIAAPAGRDALPAQGALFLADREVATVSGLAGPTAVAVLAQPGADRAALVAAVRARAGDAPVLTGADRVRADLPGALPDYIGPISVFGFTIGITAFAAIFVLTGTVALGVRQRLRELALLRTIGATPRQLRRLLGVESLVLAAVAALPGLPLGVLVAHLVAARFRHLGVVPAQFTVRVNPVVLLLAGFAGALVTLVAARFAGRRAVRIAPAQALTETAVAPRGGMAARAAVALVAAAGAVAVLTFVPLGGPFGMGMTFISSALLLCAVAALGPLLVRLVAAVPRRLSAGTGAAGWLAAATTRAEVRRTAAVAVPLVLMFAINAPLLLNGELLARLAGDQQSARLAGATTLVTGTTGLPLDTAARVAALPGVTGTVATVPTRVVLAQGGKPQDYAAQGLLRTGADGALDLAVEAGALAGDGTFAASTDLADAYGWRLGDEVPIWLADGEQVVLRLSARYTRHRGFGELTLPAGLVAAHDPRGLVTMVALRHSDDAVAERVRQRWPDLRVVPTAAATRTDDGNQQGAWELLVVVSLGFAAIAVVNTFAISAAARRREFADLRLAGATARQVHRLVDREALITVTAGLALAVAVTSAVVVPFSVAQDGVFRLVVAPATYLVLLAGVAGLGLAGGALPVRLVLRRRDLPALGDR